MAAQTVSKSAAASRAAARRKRTQSLRDGTRYAVHVSAIAVLAALYLRYYSYYYDPDEIQGFTRATGSIAIVYLWISLAITPLNTLFGWNWLQPSRRPLGLYAFFFALGHFAIFVGWDYALDFDLIVEAIFEKRFALAGFAALMIMLPLALTSTRAAMRKMKGNWKRLHKWVYLSAMLVAVHYIWLVKQNYTEPLLYTSILALMFALRVGPVRRRVIAQRKKLLKKWQQRASQTA